MSLLCAWKRPQFVAVACDGLRVIVKKDGRIERVQEDFPKFWPLTPNIVLGASGRARCGPAMMRVLEPLVKQRHDGPKLFQYLEATIGSLARDLFAEQPSTWAGDQLVVFLAGWDGRLKHIRSIVWPSFENFRAIEQLDNSL